MKVRKQLSFDLDSNILKKILGEDSWTKVYTDIGKFMIRNNFEHIERSVYMSNEPMNNTEVLRLIKDLKKEIPYITKCVKRMHQTNVGKIHSLSRQFDYDGTPGKFAQIYKATALLLSIP